MSEPAKREALAALHVAVAEALADQIVNGPVLIDSDGAVVTDPAGKPLRASATAAILNVARQFLKDNGIEVMAGVADSPIDRLAKTVQHGVSLPFEGTSH